MARRHNFWPVHWPILTFLFWPILKVSKRLIFKRYRLQIRFSGRFIGRSGSGAIHIQFKKKRALSAHTDVRFGLLDD
jgi:hypothetical protein